MSANGHDDNDFHHYYYYEKYHLTLQNDFLRLFIFLLFLNHNNKKNKLFIKCINLGLQYCDYVKITVSQT